MRPLPIVVLFAACCASGMARAEFVLQATPSSPTPLAVGPASPAEFEHRTPRRLPAPVASGFGHGVPLRFAVRQLLPKGWHARYGPGVDPDRPVSWEGGRAWDRVLIDAVRPLGLHASPAPGEAHAVLIAR